MKMRLFAALSAGATTNCSCNLDNLDLSLSVEIVLGC